MKAGSRLDKWFYKQTMGQTLDITPKYSTDWIYAFEALKPIFEIIKVDEMIVCKDDDEWFCCLTIIHEGLTTTIQKYSNSPLGAIMHASGELIAQIRGNENAETPTCQEKSSKEKSES